MASDIIQHGIYNIDYFSGSQTAIYIGDVWIDEITSMSYAVSQRKMPIYGYADTYFRYVSKGQKIVQGSFTINFKEAGYLWLALQHYQEINGGATPFLKLGENGSASADIDRRNVEAFIDGQTDTGDRNQLLSNIAAQAALTGFPSNQRLKGTSGSNASLVGPPSAEFSSLGKAEDIFERFEDQIWREPQTTNFEGYDRAVDAPELNNFDIYLAFGDFAGNNRNNHTIQRIANVHIIGSGKQIEVNGMPIQEEYQFIARNLV